LASGVGVRIFGGDETLEEQRLGRARPRSIGGVSAAVLIIAACSPAASSAPTAGPVQSPAETASPTAEATPTPPPANPTELEVIVGIGGLTPNELITVVLPQELGYFATEGVAPKFTFTTGANTVQLLTVGQADIGFTVSSNVVLAHAQDIPVRPFYNILTKSGTAITVLDDSPITSAEQLRGGTIGTATVGVGQYFNGLAMVAAAGLDPETDVEWVSVGVGAQALQALESGTVDAIVLWDAAYADMENKGAAFRYFRFPFQNEHHSAQWMATDEFIDANRAAIIGFGRAEAKATLFARTNPEAAVRIYLDAHPELIPDGLSEQEAFDQTLHILNTNLGNGEEMPGSPGIGGFSPTVWRTMADFYLEYGVLTEPLEDVSGMQIPPAMTEEMNTFDHEAIIQEANTYPTN